MLAIVKIAHRQFIGSLSSRELFFIFFPYGIIGI